MTTLPSKTRRTFVRLLSLNLLLPLVALASGGDDFNDNSIDSSKWGPDTVLGLGVLAEQNQRLEFTCNSAISDGDTLRPWKLERLPVASSWTVQVDTVNNTIPTVIGQVNSGGFTLFHPVNSTSQIYVELYAVAGGKGFVGNLETDDANVGNVDTATLVGDVPVMGAVLMVYDGASKVATCFYDLDTSDGYQWTEFASYGLAGSGGTTTNTNWGLSDTQQFSVDVYGYSAGMVITSGELYLDNFTESGGVPPPAGEPSPVPLGKFFFQSKDWALTLDISLKTVRGKEVTVASALLRLPNGHTISYPEKKVKYSTAKGYKLSFKKGTNITLNPNQRDKKSKIAIKGLTFVWQGTAWKPTGGTIKYQFLDQKGTANLLEFTGP
jgi:hypothetical protein